MRGFLLQLVIPGCLAICLISNVEKARSEQPSPTHAIAMHGEAALDPDFQHLPYANPDAPRGGRITYGVVGTYDSLNPFILNSMRTTARGMWDPEFGKLIFEPLMTRSADEPFTLYGLIAESVAMPQDRSWMEFTLRDNARWSDGKPITPEDVIFTYELLTEKGRPPFNSRMKRIAAITKTGDRQVRFDFNDEADREFPLIVAGFTPVLPKHAVDVERFGDSTLTPPIGSGPYRIAEVEPGERIIFQRREDYWGDDLPVNRGHFNFDTISVEYFRSVQARFEAFKKGIYDIHLEADPAQWERAYDFPAVADGRVVKEQFTKRTPAAMYGFVFNTRREVFKDPKVREALSMLFDFEWTNRNLFFGTYTRTGSFWHGSSLSALGVPANDQEQALLAGFPGVVSEPVMAGDWQPPMTDGSGLDRSILRAAFNMLSTAGFKSQNSKLVDGSGNPLAFEILTRTESEERLAIAYKRTLDRIGVSVTLRSVDDAQYQRRTQEFDYDMILATYRASLSPGIEQRFRWGSQSRDLKGSFNYAGASNPAIDAMIDAMVAARDRQSFESAVRALDRLLISGHYLVPLFHQKAQFVAAWGRVAHPEYTPIYGVQYPVWWPVGSQD